MRDIKYIVIHCTGGNPKQSVQSILDGWRSKGWKSNGYHVIIDQHGIATRLMDDDLIGNGVAGHNSKSVHLCYIGGLLKGKTADTRTEEQKEALLVQVLEYRAKYPKAKIVGHRDLSPDLNGDGIIEPKEWVKVCPCFDAKEEFKNI